MLIGRIVSGTLKESQRHDVRSLGGKGTLQKGYDSDSDHVERGGPIFGY